MAFSLDFRAHSEVGRVRKNNQDAGYASPNMLLVADGMGGAAAGDLASAVAAVEASRSDERLEGDAMVDHIKDVVTRANAKLAELVEADPTLDGMGTTFCGAMFSGTQLGMAHIGDSRCYVLRDGELTQLTHDHSWVQSLIDSGRLTPEQAATHPHRSLILKVLNGHATMTPDYSTVDVELGDRFLFCSDGLSGLIDDDEIAELLALDDLDRATADLAEAANNAGGHDNITVVLAEVVDVDEALDAVAPLLVGSAIERDIPDPDELADEYRHTAFPDSPSPEDSPAEADDDDDHDESERARYAPDPTPHRRWPGILAAVLAIALVLGGAAWGVTAYAKSRYFLADAEGFVGIYNGLPGSLLGQELNVLVEVRDTQVADLPTFYQRAVANTIGVPSLERAEATADQLADFAARCVEAREERDNRPDPTPNPEPQPSPSGLSTGQPNYPTYLAPITPTATEEADPEACR
ncbi:Stp1/IreP family PP2C-type Ser/Thr phosphatase [Tessaracoccus terricola]